MGWLHSKGKLELTDVGILNSRSRVFTFGGEVYYTRGEGGGSSEERSLYDKQFPI